MRNIDEGTIQSIIEIGLGDRAINLESYLPHYPTIRGSEEIFRISWSNSRNYMNNNIASLVKGLHLIEMKYKEEICSFGFGSPSPSFKLIKALVETDYKLAHNLYDWINNRGGNYYIPRTELRTRQEEQAKSESFRLMVEEARKDKKLQIQQQHMQMTKRQEKDSNARKQLLELEFEDLCRNISRDNNKPIQYYEAAICALVEDGLTEEQKTELLSILNAKWKKSNPKAFIKVIKRIEHSCS